MERSLSHIALFAALIAVLGFVPQIMLPFGVPITAQSLGMPLRWARMVLVGVISLATGAAVSHIGLVAFVGLAAPHLVRTLLRSTHAWHVCLSALMGGALLALADVMARVLFAPQELPVGVLTAVLGGAYLLWRVYRGSGGAR